MFNFCVTLRRYLRYKFQNTEGMQRIWTLVGVVLVAVLCVYMVSTGLLNEDSNEPNDCYSASNAVKDSKNLLLLRGLSKRVLDFNR
jgi:hypothetical protein